MSRNCQKYVLKNQKNIGNKILNFNFIWNCDSLIAIPNHVHGIIELKSKSVGAENFPPNKNGVNDANGVNDFDRANDYSPLRSPSKTIGIARTYCNAQQ